MNHLQNHIDNYLVHCQTQKRLDAKTLKAYRMTYANFPNNLDYRFFDQFLYPFIVNFHRKTHPFATFFVAKSALHQHIKFTMSFRIPNSAKFC